MQRRQKQNYDKGGWLSSLIINLPSYLPPPFSGTPDTHSLRTTGLLKRAWISMSENLHPSPDVTKH